MIKIYKANNLTRVNRLVLLKKKAIYIEKIQFKITSALADILNTLSRRHILF